MSDGKAHRPERKVVHAEPLRPQGARRPAGA